MGTVVARTTYLSPLQTPMLIHWTCNAKSQSLEPPKSQEDHTCYYTKGDPLFVRAYASRGENKVVEKVAEH